MSPDSRRRRVVIGVDTHKHVHVAVALDDIGGRLDARSFPADWGGYQQLLDWAAAFDAKRLIFAIEGTGSYGAGLTSAVRRRGLSVIEVLRTDRRDRRLRGKSDTLDAENAARSAINGSATAVPKTNDGVVEMIRQIKVAKDVAVKARTSAMISLKAVLVTAEPELREQLQPLTKMALIDRCASLRPGPVTSVTAATKHTLRDRPPLAATQRGDQNPRKASPGTHQAARPAAGRRVRRRRGHRRRDAHRRRRQHRPGPLRTGLGPALRRRTDPSVIRNDQPPPA